MLDRILIALGSSYQTRRSWNFITSNSIIHPHANTSMLERFVYLPSWILHRSGSKSINTLTSSGLVLTLEPHLILVGNKMLSHPIHHVSLIRLQAPAYSLGVPALWPRSSTDSSIAFSVGAIINSWRILVTKLFCGNSI